MAKDERDARERRFRESEKEHKNRVSSSFTTAHRRHATSARGELWKHRPGVGELRFEQGENREYYTKEHFDRLYGRARPWNRDQRANKVWCKDIHPAGVTCNECTSCHFCRQKSSDAKTTCQCADVGEAPEGGRGRGSWCGWCLEMRMGENIEEAIADDEWRCPACRDICNCSGANCLRHKRHLFPTQQLTRGWSNTDGNQWRII